MSAYTKISDHQLDTIAQALGGEISDLSAIEAGMSNSIYKANLQTPEKNENIVIVIHETPDRLASGLPAKRAKNIPRLLRYAAKNMKQANAEIDCVKTRLPKPYKWDEKSPYGTMLFPHAEKKGRQVPKAITVFPFIEGEELDWDISKCQSTDTIRNAGAGLALFHKSVEGFDNTDDMNNPYGIDQWMNSIDKLLGNEEADDTASETLEKLNEFLTYKGSMWNASDMINTLAEEADYIEENWDKRTAHLPRNIIHGDYYPDNMMLTKKGKQFILDFGNCANEVEAYDIACAINAWTSEDGVFLQQNMDAFLEGYNQAKPLSTEVEDQLAFLGRAASFSRALLRIEIALKTQTPDRASSPDDCMMQLKLWQLKDETNKLDQSHIPQSQEPL